MFGESLSSWRQRSAWRNGYTLFPVSSGSLRRVDPDIGLHASELEWLATGHDLDPSSLVPMTLAGQKGAVIDHLSSHSLPSWWLRGRVAGTNEKSGPMFCPVCLANDDKPFFRLHWRFGFVASCPIHCVEMLDRCPTCGDAVWPGGAGLPSRLSSAFVSFNHCWACGADLTDTGIATANSTLDALLLLAIRQRTMSVNGIERPTVEMLEALRAICHLFIRNRPRQIILKSKSKWSDVIQSLSPDSSGARTIELVGVSDRRLIVGAAWGVLSNWPISFREFCGECNLLKWHFDGAYQLHPEWMNHEISINLARHNRSVTKVVLSQTFESMKEMLGRPPRKNELRERLAWKGRKFLDELYPQRLHATEREIEQLLVNAGLDLRRCSTRRQSLFHSAVDLAIVVICLLDRQSLEAVHTQNQNAQVLEQRLAEFGFNAERKTLGLLCVLRETLRDYSFVRKSTYAPKLRQIKKRFSSLLHNAPEDLPRSVSAYWLAKR